MDYELMIKRMQTIIDKIEELGGEIREVILDEPASPEQIVRIETELGVKLPESFKKVLIEFSSYFSLRWFLPDEMERNEEFREIFCGTPNWGLKYLALAEEGRIGWVEQAFPNPEDEYDAVWHNKLAFCEVGNGDYLAFDMSYGDDASIVYLSHDGGEGHGFRLGDNFIEFIDRWSRLGFVGCEDWQWMPFTAGPESGLLPDSEAAQRFRAWLGLNI
ncbi:SMI1/KNR4 family protein [Bacillus sp. FJAT-27251]|uniref:SMI1/KNR4 family protein n=1 Tax=Bacillus sp. FJAT-27251 TaxID=1684142 RepID=UPI0006A7BE6A|nr:SMI1/KNR4 family protein [Bacillus sp. FJAT-27251]